jgi:signal transduction histidine kinase
MMSETITPPEFPPGLALLVVAIIVAFLGLYGLHLYRPRRELKDYIWLAPLSFCAAAYIFMLSPWRTAFGTNPMVLKGIQDFAIFAFSALYVQFLYPYLPTRIDPFLRGYQALQIVFAILVVFTPGFGWDNRVMVAWNIVTVIFGTILFVLIARQGIIGHLESRYIAIGMLAMAATYVIDFAVGRNWIESSIVFPFGLALQIYVFTLTLASRVPRFHAEYDTLRDNLERRVKEQTLELAERTRDLIDINAKLTERSKEIMTANQKLSVRTNELAEANLSKSQFLASMSHELRTPLNAVIGYSEILKEELEDSKPDLTEDVDKINAAGKHLLGMISEILDLSKLEAGKMELSLDVFQINDVVTEAVQIAKKDIEKNQNAFELKASDHLGTMRADMEKVRQVIVHLLSNASKFTEHGLITLQVKRENVDGLDTVVFQVSDSGIGMSPEQMKKIFRAFTQADGSHSRKYGGTGLGLAISQKFCQMMGGNITVSSEFGVGSTFEVRLPALVPDPD